MAHPGAKLVVNHVNLTNQALRVHPRIRIAMGRINAAKPEPHAPMGAVNVVLHRRIIPDRHQKDSLWQLTAPGKALLIGWGLSEAPHAPGEACMDSTERRFHLGGRLGTAVTEVLFQRDWIARIGRTRAVKVTEAGREALAQAGLEGVLTHLDETTPNDAAG